MNLDAAPAATLLEQPSGKITSVDHSASFDEFYRLHAAEIRRSLTLTLGSVDLATEATAEAMARAYARWSTVGGYDRPAAWVHRVALNWATSRWRKQRRETLADPAVVSSGADARSGGRGGSETAASDHELAAALTRLSVEHRSVVVLRFVHDWPEADIATALGIAPGTVKSRLHRALAHLARELGDTAPSTSRPAPTSSEESAS